MIRFSKALLLLKHTVMKPTSMTGTFDPPKTETGSRCNRLNVMTLSLVLTGSFLLQGCLAGAWVAVVAMDSMRSSNVTFWPFEQSWVALKDQSSDGVRRSKVKSVAVLPAEGDPEMGARLAAVLRQETTLRVEVPEIVGAGFSGADPRSEEVDDAGRSALAKEITLKLGVDTVLVSRVTGSPSHPSDWGLKTEGSRRLYLYLVNHDGLLLWKDELPFTLVKASQPSLDASMQDDLTYHVMQHVKKLRLDELGYLPKKIS